ncbi:MAG: hypothetical protein ABI760_24405 [Ferruginibacter sp.]
MLEYYKEIKISGSLPPTRAESGLIGQMKLPEGTYVLRGPLCLCKQQCLPAFRVYPELDVTRE